MKLLSNIENFEVSGGCKSCHDGIDILNNHPIVAYAALAIAGASLDFK